VGPFINGHGGFNFGVDGSQISANLNCDKVTGDESHLMEGWGGRSGHDKDENFTGSGKRRHEDLGMEHHLKMDCKGESYSLNKAGKL
jgi:hypothetical protein